jgi:hypothetical protein
MRTKDARWSFPIKAELKTPMSGNSLPLQNSQFFMNQDMSQQQPAFLDPYPNTQLNAGPPNFDGRYRRASISFPTGPTYTNASIPNFIAAPDNEFHASLNQRKNSVSKGLSTKIYALRIASVPGIYHQWSLAKTLIDGCPGAKYKGFYSIEECMQFIWEQFPSATFTPNSDGDYIMDDPEPVYQA